MKTNNPNQGIIYSDNIEKFIEDEKAESIRFNNYNWLAIWFLTAIILVSCICERQNKIIDYEKKLKAVGYIIKG